MHKTKSKFLAVTLFAATALLSGYTFAEGAIAIDSAKGSRWGVSYDHPNMTSAEDAALNKCGRGCTVVLRYPQGCGAYVIDRAPGSTIYAWAGNNSRAAAERQAMVGCRNRGGKDCIVRAWGCNSR